MAKHVNNIAILYWSPKSNSITAWNKFTSSAEIHQLCNEGTNTEFTIDETECLSEIIDGKAIPVL